MAVFLQINAYLRELNLVSIIFRLLIAICFGGLIGLDRERKRRPAGFRTYMLVCLGAALTILLSQYEYNMICDPWADVSAELGVKTDVSRFGAQVINGIGFLGAGTILVTQRRRVKGLTTAAGLWASAAIGLCFGAGFYEGGIIAALLILAVELLFSKLEYRIMDNAREVNLLVEYKDLASLNGVLRYMKEVDLKILSLEILKSESNPANKNCVNIDLLIHRKLRIKDMIADIANVPGIIAVERL